MTAEREQEIKNILQSIIDSFDPTDEELELTMFSLISRYNQQYSNEELIGGEWAREHGFDLP